MKVEQLEQFFKDRNMTVHIHNIHPGSPEKFKAAHSWRNGTRYVTEAVILNQNGVEVIRGISKCGPRDNPVRSEGKVKALGKAYRAYLVMTGHDRITLRAKAELLKKQEAQNNDWSEIG